MKRITISLPDNLAADLAREGQRRNMPMSEIARDAIALHLMHLGAERIVDGKRMLPFAALGRSKGDGNFARDMERDSRQRVDRCEVGGSKSFGW